MVVREAELFAQTQIGTISWFSLFVEDNLCGVTTDNKVFLLFIVMASCHEYAKQRQ